MSTRASLTFSQTKYIVPAFCRPIWIKPCSVRHWMSAVKVINFTYQHIRKRKLCPRQQML
jgi:hypothetical protein